MAPTHLVSAIEELAAKRREFTSAILTLASIAGVSAEPYLAYDRNLTPAVRMPEPVPAGSKRPAPELPPNPQRPASPSTNGTGRAHKVEGEKAAAILQAVKSGPKSPGDLAKLLGLTTTGAMYHAKLLKKAGHVAFSGARQTRRVSLA